MAQIAIKVPPLGVSVFTGVLAEWYVKSGDAIKVDQPLWSVETDKVTQDVLAPAAGTIGELLVEAGAVVEPEQVVGYIETAGGGSAKPAAESGKAAKAENSETNGKPSAATATATAPPAKAAAPAKTTGNGKSSGQISKDDTTRPHKLSPRVRRLIRENELSDSDLNSIEGTGRSGRIKASDVERYLAGGRKAEVAAPARASAPAPAGKSVEKSAPKAAKPVAAIPTPVASGEEVWTSEKLTTIRKTIAGYLRQSVDNAVHTVSIDECDVTRLLEVRKNLNAVVEPQYGIKITVTTLIARAVALALREFPLLNSQLDLEQGLVHTAGHIHLGIAVDAPQGLTVPVVRFADTYGLLQLQAEINRMANLVREGKASLADLQGSTYTITNAGAEGSIASTPIINYPNVGILGVHKIRRMPVVRGDDIVIRDIVNFSGCFDHRLVDGVYNVRFMNRVISLLEQPELMLL